MLKKLFLFLLISCIGNYMFSQAGPGGPAPCWPPPCVPIDGGITIFSIIAAAFGYRFLSKNK